jgi:predicted aspartyl protease
LLGLRGIVNDVAKSFLVDSGASSNFIGLDVLGEIGIDHDLVVSQKVALADGKILHTCGSVVLKILFGQFAYSGTFLVL